MNKPRLHPATRLSLSLVALIISILLIGELLGIVPDKSQVVLESRKNMSETLAVQFALAAAKKDFTQIEITLNTLVERNSEILSGAIRKVDGSLLAVTENHKMIWQGSPDGRSSLSFIQVPIIQGDELWGTVELSYDSLYGHNFWDRLLNSIWGMLIFLIVAGFLSFRFFLKRTLKELNPSDVIPSRVKSAFDTLTEGVLILDNKAQIVMANSAFCEDIELDFEWLLGKHASSLAWGRFSVEQMKVDWTFPWLETLQEREIKSDIKLTFSTKSKGNRIFSVNCSPILGTNKYEGTCKGVLVTFDNVTELENKNQKLRNMLSELEMSKNEVFRQNNELKMLAEIDPLTGCYNRRALFALFNQQFDIALNQDINLFCIMLDIDHFKSVNDNYGHQTGDEVIKLVANIIKENLQENDIIGRYGGEEFCLVLPDISHENVLKIAERIRESIMNSNAYKTIGIEFATISLGISSINDSVQNPNEMVDLADKALYFAKKSGRNRVIEWHDDLADDATMATADKSLNNNHVYIPPFDNEIFIANKISLQSRIKELEILYEKQNKTLQNQINFDPITGLPGRALLNDRLNNLIARAQRNKQTFAVVSIKFTPYRRIYSTLGHKAAEKLIIEIARKLSDVFRSSDTVATDITMELEDSVLSRKNDDSFYILVPELTKKQSITKIISRLSAEFKHPIEIENFNIQVDSIIGISMYPTDAREPDSLVKYADQARDYAESYGKNNCQFYSARLNEQFVAQLQIESELMRAIECNEFEIYYQPIVNIQHGVITKLEALVRWNHPEKGLLLPANFIEVAEESELIIPIGERVLREVIQQLAIWREEISQDIVVSINISALQLKQDSLVKKITGFLREAGVPPKNLILEITENTIVQDIEKATRIVKQLHDLEIQVALDDFGTGYSSLQYIHKFPVDIIKIDRSFINDITSTDIENSIVSLVIDLSRNLGFTTVAEGVETETQFKQLCDLKCDEIQGYLVSQPVSKNKIRIMLERQYLRMHKKKVMLAG